MDLSEKIHGEIPQLKRCCFCIPLRRGLVGWGYAKLILNILIVLYIAEIIFFILAFGAYNVLGGPLAVLFPFVVDIPFTIVLIVAGHKKSAKLMRIFYRYSIAWLIYLICFSIYILFENYSRFHNIWARISYYHIIFDLVASIAFMFAVTFVQVYIILLSRSEAAKLLNQTLSMQFVNNAADGERVYANGLCTDDSAQCTDFNATIDNGQCEKKEQDSECMNNGQDSVNCADKEEDIRLCIDNGQDPVQCTDISDNSVKYTDDGLDSCA